MGGRRTLRVRGGLWGVKRGATGDRVETPGQNSPPTGTVSPRPRSRGPQAHRQGAFPRPLGLVAALGPGRRGRGGSRVMTLTPAPEARVTGAPEHHWAPEPHTPTAGGCLW